MKWLLVIPVLIIPMFELGAAGTSVLTGPVTHVRDGDTIVVDNIPIRFNGVSAPELKAPLGQKSKIYMERSVLGKEVRCELNGARTYDRFVAVCYRNSIDIGISIIQAGLAIDCPRFSDGKYAEYETIEAVQTIKLPRYCEIR